MTSSRRDVPKESALVLAAAALTAGQGGGPGAGTTARLA
jgi:hypothetical protein